MRSRLSAVTYESPHIGSTEMIILIDRRKNCPAVNRAVRPPSFTFIRLHGYLHVAVT